MTPEQVASLETLDALFNAFLFVFGPPFLLGWVWIVAATIATLRRREGA